MLDLHKKAAKIRVDTLRAIHKSGSGFTGSSMSVVEILCALYYGEINGRKIVKIDAKKPGSTEQDYVILAKSHAIPTQYSILADLGFFDPHDLGFVGQVNSLLQSRSNMKVPGITATIPSHGNGLSVACGLAMALKMDRQKNYVYTVVGDGELQEGALWEAAMAAGHYKLNNLILFVDNNGLQMDGSTRAVMDVNPIQAKFEAFNWKVFKVLDGHDFEQIFDAIAKAYTISRQPICIWCNTVSGKGVEFAEGKSGYFASALSDAEINEVLPKLMKIYEE